MVFTGLKRPEQSACSGRFASVVCRGSRELAHGQHLAAVRARESKRKGSLFQDTWAPTLSLGVGVDKLSGWQLAAGAACVQYIDQTILKAANLHHDTTRGDFNQVVLIGDALDTRPFRLPWPPGTVLFLLASAESHARGKELLDGHNERAAVPRGCLLRRVNADPFAGESIEDPLLMAGFQGHRASAWIVQGAQQGFEPDRLGDVLTQVTACAAFGSIVVGDAAGLTRAEYENLLASNGLLGTVVDAQSELIERSWELSTGDAVWLSTSQHQRMSLAEMSIFDEHVAAAEETDEDFFGNFS